MSSLAWFGFEADAVFSILFTPFSIVFFILHSSFFAIAILRFYLLLFTFFYHVVLAVRRLFS